MENKNKIINKRYGLSINQFAKIQNLLKKLKNEGIPKKPPKIRYNIPISLWLTLKTHLL